MTEPKCEPTPASHDAAKAIPRISSQDLLREGRRVIIAHRGEEYVLQITRAGRLILTK